MKKVYTSLVMILFLLSFFIGIFIYSFFSTAYLISDKKSDATVVYIYTDSKGEISLTKKDFYCELKDSADRANLNIYKIAYPACGNNEKKKIVVYAYVNNERDFYKNIKLAKGRLLNKTDSGQVYISSEKNNDPNCVGLIKSFDKSIALEIRPIDSNKNDLLYGRYVINGSKLDKFKQALNSQPVSLNTYKVSASFVLDSVDESGLGNFYLISLISILACGIIFICILISCAYILVYRYKKYAAKKMFGSGNLKLIFSFWLEFVLTYLLEGFIAYACLIAFLYFYNDWAQLKDFIFLISLAHIIIFVVYCLLLFILSLLIKFINVGLMIKSKKPLFGLSLLNNFTKVVFCTVLYSLAILLSNNLLQLKNQISDLKRWEFTKNYAFAVLDLELSPNHTQKDFRRAEQVLMKKCDQLYILTNNVNNNLLMVPADALYKKYIRDYYEREHRPKWSYEMNSVTINNNYLELNPIYDVNNNRVDLTEYENDYVVTILVPQKYKNVEKELRASYQSCFDFWCEDSSQKLSLNLIYVKDNQKYFSMNPLLSADKNFEYNDPIGIVINNCCVECGGSLCGAMTQGLYYFHIENPNDPYESMNETIKKLDMENNFITIASLYNFVEQKFYSTAQLMNIYLILAMICTVPYVVSLLATIANYIERKKQILAVKYINGHSFFKLHYKLFLRTILMWSIIFCSAFFVFCRVNFFNVNSNIVFAMGIVLCLTDLSLEYFILKIASLKKAKDLVKGM